ncbi:MAG: hypothetical protein IT160_07045 [Bryobacterales bacterium]|nr:hypothetical protein [Bryobacterales bacterium]
MARKKAAVLEEIENSSAVETPKFKKHMPPEEFFRATAAYPDTSATTYRVYRLWPVIDRGLVGLKHKWIDKLMACDEAFIRQKFGSGEYEVYFHDANKPWQQQTIARCKVSITDPELEPVLDHKEIVIGHERNVSYIQGQKARGTWRGVDVEETEGDDMGDSAAVVAEVAGLARDVMNANSRPPAELPGMKETVGMVAEGFKAVMANAINPFEQLRQAKEVLGLGGPVGNDGMVAVLLKQMEMQNSMLLKLLERDRPPASSGAAWDELEKVDQLLRLADRLNGRGGDGGGGLLGNISQIAGAVQSLSQSYQATRAAAPAPAAYPAPAGFPYAPGPVVNPASGPVDSSGGDGSMFGFPSLNELMQVGQQAYQAYRRELAGSQFAEAVEVMQGPEMLEAIARMGRSNILMALSAHPAAASAVSAEREKVEAFIDDFLRYARGESVPGNTGVPNDGGM